MEKLEIEELNNSGQDGNLTPEHSPLEASNESASNEPELEKIETQENNLKADEKALAIEMLQRRVEFFLNDETAKAESQMDYKAVAVVIKKFLEEKGIESALICLGHQSQEIGASVVVGPKPNLLEIIKYINAILLKQIAPHVKIKMTFKRI